MKYTCRTNSPRGSTTVVAVQDGYEPGTRTPRMVEHRQVWKDVNCGYLERASDEMCGDCPMRYRSTTNEQ